MVERVAVRPGAVVARSIESLNAIRVMDTPVGKAGLFIVGLGIADILTTSGAALLRLPAIAWGGGFAYAARNVRPIRNFLGETGSEVAAICMIAAPVDDMFNLRERTGSLFARVLKPAGLVPIPASPVKMVKKADWAAITSALAEAEEKRRAITEAVTPGAPVAREAEEFLRRYSKGGI